MRIIFIAGLLSMTLSTLALAQENKYQITSAEVSACTSDAMQWCAGAYPDQDRLMACLKANRAQLSNGCGVVFDAGLKRRHLSADLRSSR
jgi:hypothetical protein